MLSWKELCLSAASSPGFRRLLESIHPAAQSRKSAPKPSALRQGQHRDFEGRKEEAPRGPASWLLPGLEVLEVLGRFGKEPQTLHVPTAVAESSPVSSFS